MPKDSGKQVKSLLNKYALVTGASGGLGREFVLELVERGYHVILLARNKERLDYFAHNLLLMDHQMVKTFECDITKDDQVKTVFDYLINNEIKIDMLINNAGYDYEGWFNKASHEDTISIAQVNVLGTLNMIHRILDVKAKELTIINVASLAGFFPMPMKAVYSASKRFIIELTRTLNYELKDDNVHLTVLCPAGMPTKIEVLNKIKALGLIGAMTTVNFNIVVKKTIDKALKKKEIYIPGWLNVFMLKISLLIPRRRLVKKLGKKWKRTFE